MTQPLPVPAALSTRVLLQPLRGGLAQGQDNTVDVLVRVQAPDAPPGQLPDRAPHALALVIDKSGSMAGQPLAEAIRCARMVVDRLRPGDSVSLVEFDDRVRRLWPAVPRGDGVALRQALDRIHDGGSTDLHGGWREGAQTLVDVAGSGLKRVVLLSDGAANQGVQDPQAIAAQCSEIVARGITTSTYGLGHHFNEELMVAMARAGAGNSYYGDTADDLMEPFQRELDLLGNLCLRDLQISFQTPADVQAEMLNDLPRTAAGWRLADLAWGAEAWAVVRVRLEASQVPSAGSSVGVLKVRGAGLEPEGSAIDLERVGLTLPVLTAAAWAGLPEDPLVAQCVAEIEASVVLQQMRHAAGQGDWPSVDRLLEDAQRRFGGHEWVAAVLESMKQIAASRSRERLSKEALYSASSMNYRLSAKDEQIHFSLADESTSKPSYLRRKPSQGKGRP